MTRSYIEQKEIFYMSMAWWTINLSNSVSHLSFSKGGKEGFADPGLVNLYALYMYVLDHGWLDMKALTGRDSKTKLIWVFSGLA